MILWFDHIPQERVRTNPGILPAAGAPPVSYAADAAQWPVPSSSDGKCPKRLFPQNCGYLLLGFQLPELPSGNIV